MILTVVLVVLFVLATGDAENRDRHSLTYIYTALSKDPKIPGIHEFTAMGILDSRVIHYFDSTTQVKTPRTDWMKECLEPKYWDEGTRSLKDKQQWFKDYMDILKERMNQTNNDMHVLQWRQGCEGEEQPDGSLKYSHGLDMYSYDGDDFLYFNDSHSVWVAPVKAAEQTKRKWDQEQKVHNYPKGYLEIDCMEWLKKYLTYGGKDLSTTKKPEVYVFANNAKSKTNVVLTCMATGFYPLEIQIHIQRNSRILTKDDGVMSTGTRPNGDNTYQRRDSVEIPRSDLATYSCHIHQPTGVNIMKVWDGKLPDPEPDSPPVPVGVIVGWALVLVLVVVVVGVLVFLYRQGAFGEDPGPVAVKVEPAEEVPLNQNQTNADGSQGSLDRKDSGVPSTDPASSGTSNSESDDSLFSFYQCCRRPLSYEVDYSDTFKENQ
ncbi:major histocompatibility complex class I-related gene protein-like isoform X2 [Sphaeramia orbicularis]|uniref:major histocompatibility complex class I-related gene protein-like isoform X2 n=1 Tax=Sphaeramia orbicularis TaxID=375764 RepID=UPI00117D9260|nr:major histocompatibility complex class I-related gene protein-like isoform X2 [Sphaeramia orbicularis]